MRLLILMISLIAVGIQPSAFANPLEDVKRTAAHLTFTVDVLAKQCNVEVGPTQLTDGKVYLGSIPGKPGTVGPTIPIAFRFTECKSVSAIQSIAFTRDLGSLNSGNPGSEPGGPNQGFVSTNKKKVRVFLWEDSAGTNPFRSKNFTPAQTINPAAWVPTCYAQAKVIDVDGDGVAAQASDFEGKAEFTITYQ